MTKEIVKVIKRIIALFTVLHGASFVGIKGYISKTTGEVSNHLVNVNFSYLNAVKKDLKALNESTLKDVESIEKLGFNSELIIKAILKLKFSFEKNLNPDTKSNQSKGQINAYTPICNSMKLHIESGKIHIYALSVSKEILTKGTYKKVNSRELTLCQNAVKKYFNFSTSKFRQFIVDEKNLSGVNVSGNKLTLA